MNETRKIIRSSEDQVAVFGRQRKDIKLWAIQSNVIAAKMTEFWLEMFLIDQRQIVFTTYLPALHLQPGDIVRIDYANGSGVNVLNGTLARVQKLTHQLLDCAGKKMEQIAVTAVTKLWDVDVQVAPVDEDECNPPTGDAEPEDPGSDGIKPNPDHPDPTTTTTTTTSTTTTAGPTTTSTTTTGGPTTTTTSTTTTAAGCCTCDCVWNGTAWSCTGCTSWQTATPPSYSGTTVGEHGVGRCMCSATSGDTTVQIRFNGAGVPDTYISGNCNPCGYRWTIPIGSRVVGTTYTLPCYCGSDDCQ